METVLAIEGLTRRFGERVVLSDLDLEVAQGERVAVRGPNGVGKTTLLRCIAGTLEPTSGTIRVAGHPAGSIEARRSIGLSLSQERSFYMRLSGAENLRLFAGVRGLSRRAARVRVDELVDELELSEIAAQRCDKCSSGQLQQLALARALLQEPALLLLDEPTRSLDTDARERLWAAVERIGPRMAVLCATHVDDDLDRLDRHVSLDRTWRMTRAVVAALARRDFELTQSYRLALRLRHRLGRDRPAPLLLHLEDRGAERRGSRRRARRTSRSPWRGS